MDEKLPDLAPRFLPPLNWEWEFFTRTGKSGAKRSIRTGYVFPEKTAPKGAIICLPGLGDFGEKYFETAHWALAHDFAFFVIDWVGQGRSTRYLSNPHKRHSAGFCEDISDLHEWISNIVIPAATHPENGTLPFYMLAHSMGGHIGLHYLARRKNLFKAAAFSAPMWGIKAVERLPTALARAISKQMHRWGAEHYVPGGTNWNKMLREMPSALDIFSSDPERTAVHNVWCLKNPALQVGSVTNTWLYEALLSCGDLFEIITPDTVNIPVLVGIAGKEKLVSNRDIRKIAERIPQANILEFPESRHEILMETDSIRDAFLNGFLSLIGSENHG